MTQDLLTRFACRMDAPDGPECFCGQPSAVQAGLCLHHAVPENLQAEVDKWLTEGGRTMTALEPWLQNFMVGDAYGAGFEFASRHPNFADRKNDGQTYYAHPRDSNHRPGMPTDDTQMTLAVRHIVQIGFGYESHSFAREFCEMYQRREAPGYGAGMREVMPRALRDEDPGTCLMRQFRDFHATSSQDKCGAAMRAIPCGTWKHSWEAVVLSAIAQARATHHHPDSIDAAIVVALAAYDGSTQGHLAAARHVGWRNPRDWTPSDWSDRSYEGKVIVQATLGLLSRHETLFELLIESVNLGGDVDTLAALCLGLGTLAGKRDDLPATLREKFISPPLSELAF